MHRLKNKKEYEKLMRRCISLAKKSKGRTSPNPLVGAIIFDDDFKIISEGRHKYYGGNHAERNAIFETNEDLKGKSIIVNLEPCSHFGKTPPCADLIIEKGFKRVIFGIVDPNPLVAGNGKRKLQEAGIEVIEGILEEECRELNRFFIKNQTEKLPYITIKTATTLDGKIATSTGNSKWITDEKSRYEVQKLRNEYDAILTSSKTVIADNPSLTCRAKNGRNPVRIIIDSKLRTPVDSRVYNDDGAKVITIISENVKDELINKYPKNIQFIKCSEKDNHIDLKEAVQKLFNSGIKSILIECGGKLNAEFIKENLADELIQFIAPKILGDKNGINFVESFERNEISMCNNLNVVSTKKLKNDIMIIGKFIKTNQDNSIKKHLVL